jgi:hypothetical protein
MYGYIYKTTDLETGKIYVGQHKAKSFDSKYYGSGIIITSLIKKFGFDRFKCELLESCNTPEELNEKEIYWINKLDCLNINVGYNIASGGAFGDSGYHQGMCGKPQSEKQKSAAREYQQNNPKTQQMKDKMSVAMKGNNNASHGKGMLFIHFGYDIQTRVHKDLIPYYLDQGWECGKCQKVIDNQKKAFKEKYANGTYITDGIVSKYIQNDKLEEFLNIGWKIGKGPANYINRKFKTSK